jgi:hypothetical protein
MCNFQVFAEHSQNVLKKLGEENLRTEHKFSIATVSVLGWKYQHSFL